MNQQSQCALLRTLLLLLWVAAVMPTPDAFAQSGAGKLEGRVVRSSGDAPVQGANVVLVGTLYGTVTDEAGRFSLGVVRPGSYVLRVSMTGLALVDRELNVPDDLDRPVVVVVREARLGLGQEPLAATAESFQALVTVPAQGDPYLADALARIGRVAGVGQRRFAAAYAAPVVRALSGNRTVSGLYGADDGLLSLPGVGTLDFGTVVESPLRAFVVVDPVAAVAPATGYVGLARDRRDYRDDSRPRDRVVADLGYQSNLEVFSSGISTTGASPKVRAAAAARYTSGRDYASADDMPWDGGFRQGGVVVNAEASPEGSSSFSLNGRVAQIGAAELPGSGLEMDRADHADLSVGWTATPDGPRLRRTDVSIGWSRSSADLTAASSGRDWSRMDAEQTRLHAIVAADLYSGAVDRLHAGVAASSEVYDWRGWPLPGSSDVTEAGLDAGRVRLAPFALAAVESERLTVAFSTRLDVERTRAATEAEGSQVSWRSAPAAASYVAFKPDRQWTVSLTLSTMSMGIPLWAISSADIPTPDRLPVVPVRGNSDLAAERLFFAGSRVTRIRSRDEVSLGAYVVSLDGYLSPQLGDQGQYAYANAAATLVGFEMRARRDLLPFVQASGFLAYAWGRNRTVGEPMPIVNPLNGRIDLTASAARGRLLLEFSTEFAASQNRVAASLMEQRSDGYAAFHMWLAFPVSRRIGLRTGVFNLFDARFAPHGNVFVDEQNARLAAPGRSWVLSARFRY